MKLFRFGAAGQERTGVLFQDKKIDVSALVRLFWVQMV
jgi:hypothetical protein